MATLAPIDEEIAKAERTRKNSVGRKSLADISNVSRIGKGRKSMAEAKRSTFAPSHAQDYDRLLKEYAAVVALLQQKEKVIEYSNREFQKLQVAFHQLKQQNCQLARANTQMLGELNLTRDRIKIVEHALKCQGAVQRKACLNLRMKDQLNNILSDKISHDTADLTNSVEEERGECPLPSRKTDCTFNGKRPSRNISSHCSVMARNEKAEKGKDDRGSKLRCSGNINTQVETSTSVIELKGETDETQQNVPDCITKKKTLPAELDSAIKVHQAEENNNNNKQRSKRRQSSSFSSIELKDETDETQRNVSDCFTKNKTLPVELDSAIAVHQTEENNINNRRTKRRQSSSFNTITSMPISEINSRDGTIMEELGQQDHAAALIPKIINKKGMNLDSKTKALTLGTGKVEQHQIGKDSPSRSVGQELPETSSTGRPSRRVTIGVCYREKPLNAKMRRDD